MYNESNARSVTEAICALTDSWCDSSLSAEQRALAVKAYDALRDFEEAMDTNEY